MSLAEAIKAVAPFATSERNAMNPGWSGIHFAGDHIYALNPMGGACELAESGIQCSVPAERLLKVLRAVKGEPTFKQSKDRKDLIVASGKSKATLPASPLSIAPAIIRPKAVKWKHTAALSGTERVAWSVGQDTTRSHLLGIHLGQYGAESTNGCSLARLSGTDYCELLKAPDSGILVPPAMLKGIPQETWIATEGNRLFVAKDKEGNAFRFASLLEAQFPPAQEIIKGLTDQPAGVINRESMIDVIKRAKLSGMELVLRIADDRIQVTADEHKADTLFGFLDQVVVEYEDGPYQCDAIGVDAKYLLPALEATTSDHIKLRIRGELDPVVVEDGDYIAVVMPYRV